MTGEEIILPVSTEEGNNMSRSNKMEVEQVVKIFIVVYRKNIPLFLICSYKIALMGIRIY
jgi:hypothetical protein